ncbi:PRTRC system protein A [Pseudoduganella sp. R-34]|uniref:PRTRC system protein A n=1 Tax=Pseudoduganella sp. R-34 TaxID=3404062 RepID=UPI003CEACB54
MDKRDVALQSSCPVISTPLFSPFTPLERNGERIVLAANGTFLEVRRPWARIVTQVGPALTAKVPFGVIHESFELTAGRIPRALLREFVAWAQRDSEVEIGGIITWNEHTGEYALMRSKSNHATSGSLEYELPTLEEGVHIIVDCHSHSHHAAYFSGVDDQDDMHAVKYAFVVGHCNTNNPSFATRLCVRGAFKNQTWSI